MLENGLDGKFLAWRGLAKLNEESKNPADKLLCNRAMITSKDNRYIKHIRQLLNHRKYRLQHQQCVVETTKYIHELCQRIPHLIDHLLYRNGAKHLLPTHTTIPSFEVDATLFDRLPKIHGAQLLSVINTPTYPAPHPVQTTILYLDGVQIPANLGAIIRSAVAFKADYVALAPGSCDPFHPDAIRASAGLVFQIPITTVPLSGLITTYPNLPLYRLDSNSSESLQDIVINMPNIMIIGSESGFSDTTQSLLTSSSQAIKITTESHVDSLNVAVSTGILLHTCYSKSYNSNSNLGDSFLAV